MATTSSATDPVSDADHAAEARAVALLRAARPDDGIVAEEGSGDAGTTGARWVVDPLDGTVNYLYGTPQWSVSIAALAPDGASDLTEVSRALLATGYSYVADERREQVRREARLIASVVTEVPGVRRDAPGVVANGAGIHASLVALVGDGA